MNAHAALLAAAKLVIMESADLTSMSSLSERAHVALNEAIEAAGGWTDAESARLDELILGENVSDAEGGEA